MCALHSQLNDGVGFGAKMSNSLTALQSLHCAHSRCASLVLIQSQNDLCAYDDLRSV